MGHPSLLFQLRASNRPSVRLSIPSYTHPNQPQLAPPETGLLAYRSPSFANVCLGQKIQTSKLIWKLATFKHNIKKTQINKIQLLYKVWIIINK